MNIEFNDSRTHFRSITFSNCKKTQVIKKLEESLYYQNNEDALFCTAELLCSGFLLELWNLYIYYVCKYIHIDNPKLSIFLNNKFNEFKLITKQTKSDLDLRNVKEVWALLFTITTILCECNKSTILNNMKFKFDFNTNEVFSNLKAPDVTYIQPYFKNGDPKEMFIPLNELIYHLKVTKNNKEIYYWIEWIIEYDIIMVKKKKPLKCIQRDFMKTNICNIIWMVWEILLSFNEPEILKKIILSYLDLFSIKYNIHSNKKKIYIIFVCIMFITNNNKIDYNRKIIENTNIFQDLDENIDKFYIQIKKNEMIIE
jgi:hypothetical protein